MNQSTPAALKAEPHTPPDAVLLGFARALRAAGLPVTADRERVFLEAVVMGGAQSRRHVYWSGRATLTASPADIEPYDSVFTAWFSGQAATGGARPADPLAVTRQAPWATMPPAFLPAPKTRWCAPPPAARRCCATVTSARSAVPSGASWPCSLPACTRARPCARPDAGFVPAPAPSTGVPRCETSCAAWVSPARFATTARRFALVGVVLLIDVSGSMSPYADSLLRLAHAYVQSTASGSRTEVFTMGTRLTHVTKALRDRDADRALVAAGQVVPDWSGGTRLGESLAAFLDRWGRRGMARGAVTVVFSDGWERDGPEQLGEQMRRLAALAHRVVWANPHRGRAGYQPVQQGIVAALPHIDEFVAGHSLAAFEELIEVVARA